MLITVGRGRVAKATGFLKLENITLLLIFTYKSIQRLLDKIHNLSVEEKTYGSSFKLD